MNVILTAFREYRPKYDKELKILHLYGKVRVKDFVKLRALLKSVRAEVEDIRVNQKETTMTLKEKERAIVEYYGVLHQLKYFYSEIFELTEAIIKYETKFNDASTWAQLYNNVVEEIADVQMMLNQLKEFYSISDITIDLEMNQKANRQLERIEKENEQCRINRQTDC